ncbi:MAG: hypothetical protein RIR68_1295 [Pseudomonadota bacterium]
MPSFCLHRFFIRLVAGLMLIWTQPIFAVDLKAQGWGLPITVDASGMVPTLKGTGDQAGLHLYLNEYAPLLAPADGTLIYKGAFNFYQSGFMLQHADGLISLIYNTFAWEGSANIKVDQPVIKGQLLSRMLAGTPARFKQLLNWNVHQVNADELLELQKKIRHAQLNNSQIEHISVKSALQLGAFELAKDFELDKDVNAFTVQRLQNTTSAPISWEYAYLMPAGVYDFKITSGNFFKTERQFKTFISAGDVLTHYVKKLPNGDFVFGKHDVTTSAVNSLARAPVAAQAIEVSAATNSSQGPITAPLKPSADAVILTPPPQVTQPVTPPPVAQPSATPQEDDRIQKAQAERLMLEQLTQAQKPAPIVTPPMTPAVPTRRALVIGNDSYQSVPKLLNAREDAQAMARSLSDMGFQVQLELDLRERSMRAALRQFKSRVEGGDEVIIFFAGHGVQLAGSNYLLPVDITGENEEQIRDESIQLQRILDDMTEKRAKFTLAMLDACRDNPFKGSGRAIGGRGLAPTSAATGQMVIFSAGTGQQALDKLGPNDPEKNGLFTRVFLKEMQKPGISVDRILRNVRTEVVNLAKTVGHDQVPAIYDQVVGEYFLKR